MEPGRSGNTIKYRETQTKTSCQHIQKRSWDARYPEKNRVSKQNLRANATRFENELEMNV